MPKISNLPDIINLDINDETPFVSKDNQNVKQTMKVKVSALATKLNNNIEYGSLNTTDKKIIGAINEVNTKASQFDNMTATASGSIATFDNGGDDIPVSEFECEIVATGGGGTPDSPIAINGFSQADITVTDNDQIANLYTVAFGQTIYGGRLIYNGQWSIEATYELAVFDGSVDENWEAFGSKSFTINLLTMQTVNQYENGLVNYLPFTTSSSEFGILIGSNNKTIYCMQMVGNLTGVTDLASWKTYLSNNNLEFTYPLATPVIIPITSSTRVKTISGDNNIYSNTGDCELKYFTNKADSLAELIKAFVV